jgi:copper homeostasis protein
MIRPRVGDFLYSREELAIMLEDIRIIKELGLGNRVRGFVLGVLNRDGRVDVECMKV